MNIAKRFRRLNDAANGVMNLAYADERLAGMWSGDPLRIALEELETALIPDYDEELTAEFDAALSAVDKHTTP